MGAAPELFGAYSAFQTVMQGLDFWKIMNDPDVPLYQKAIQGMVFVTSPLAVISPRLAVVLRDKLKQFCFPAGTEVATAEGQKPIEEIREGDWVWAQSDQTGGLSLKQVREVFVNVAAALVVIHVGTNTVEATPGHPFWIVDEGWKAAGQLQIGDLLITRNGQRLPVAEIEHKTGAFTVYNFEVEEAHTYFVNSAQFLVHNNNKKCNFKWGNPKSLPTYGHTFLDHGKKVKNSTLADRARDKGHQVGKYLDDEKAANEIAAIAKGKPMGEYNVPLPQGVAGTVFLPDGTTVIPDMMRVVVKADGSVRTSFPYSSAHPSK